jgi:hypothetical protein
LAYFFTTYNSGAIPSSSVPMTNVSSSGFQKDLQGEVLVFGAFPSFMGSLPGYMVLSELGVDFPFKGWQEEVPQFSRNRLSELKDLLGDKTPLGLPQTILSTPPDTTPLLPIGKLLDFDWDKYTPIKAYEHRASVERPGWTMFPEFVPATTFSTNSCDLLSEIQRHMLEPTIDGGLTWSDLWTKTEVQKFLNNRLSRFFLETGVVQEEFSIAVQSGISEYNYPEDLIQAKRLSFEENLSLYDGLVSFWRLEEASGTRFDSFGPNDLTPTNTPGNAVGKIGFGTSFVKTSSQEIAITDATQVGLNPNTNSWSISAWIKPDNISAAALYYIVSKGAIGAPPNAAGYSMYIAGTGFGGSTPYLGTWFGDDTSVTPAQGHFFLGSGISGTWVHVVAVFDKAKVYVQTYKDGSRLSVNNDGGTDSLTFFGHTNTGPVNSTRNFAIGGNTAGTGFFDGVIDAVGIWNRVLTAEEVAILYNDGNGRELYLGQHDGPYVVLPRVDPFTQDNGIPGWEDDGGTPSVIIEEPRRPLSIQLAPIPDVSGSIEGIYVADPDDIGDACVPLPIPNFLTWIIKWGVISDMLRKEGEANDPQRAQYAEGRWKEGIQLTKLLLGFNDVEEKND